VATKTGKYWTYDSQQELIEDVLHNEDIVFALDGVQYCMGPSASAGRMIAICPDGDAVSFASADEQLDYRIGGVPLRDRWRDMRLMN